MKGDFTRVTFDPLKHYSRVLMQQGRVQLDADWNEQAAILLHYLEALTIDLIGPVGGPANNLGFAVSAATNGNKQDFAIGTGHYYVDGLLCENENALTYFSQHDYYDNYPSKPRTSLLGGPYLVYLDVWEQHLTNIEDAHMTEVALGGPDTATRAKIVWQVKVLSLSANQVSKVSKLMNDIQLTRAKLGSANIPAKVVGLGEQLDSYFNQMQLTDYLVGLSNTRLRVRLAPDQDNTDACTIVPSSAYRGQENQLYRVEIHDGGTLETATFKWSRDNGSTVAAWQGNNDDGSLKLSSIHGFAGAPYVEITSAADDLHGRVDKMRKVVSVEGDALHLDSAPEWDDQVAKKVRRWDQMENESVALNADGVIPIQETGWIDLENGIQVQFQPPAEGKPSNQYRAGDYWLIPARTNGTIEWPPELDVNGQPKMADHNVVPRALEPFGIEHHYAPLWVIDIAKNGEVTVGNKDLRRRFASLAK